MVPDFDTFQVLCEQADKAGREAVANTRVAPMMVGSALGFSNEIDYSKPTEYVADGPCGFAWCSVYPEFKGNTRLGKEERAVLEKCGFEKDWTNVRKYSFWINDFDQSVQKKEAYARAFAKVLSDNGISASSGSRLD